MAFGSVSSRLGKKLSAVFLLAALLPLITVSALVYFYTAEYVLEQKERELKKEAKILNMVLLERLSFIKNLVLESQSRPDTRESLGEYFEELPPQWTSRQPLPVLSETVELDSNARGQFVLTLSSVGLGERYVFRVRPEFLFGSMTVLSEEYAYCLLSSMGVEVFCSGDLSGKKQVLLDFLAKGERLPHSWTLESTEHDQSLRITTRPLLLSNEFETAEQWLVFTSIPLREIYAPNRFFRYLFISMLTITFLLVILISQQQIVRLLTPLRRLREGAESLAKQGEIQAIDVKSHDEFEDLANAFNHMSRSVQLNFSVLKGFSKLDRLIVENRNFDEVCAVACAHLGKVLASDLLLIAYRPSFEGQELELYVSQKNEKGRSGNSKNQFLLESFIEPSLRARHAWTTDQLAELSPELGPHLKSLDCQDLCLIPMFLGEQWLGFAALGNRKKNSFSADDLEVVKGLAERLVVSMSDISKGQALYHQANFDFLTDLPNRKLLREKLQDQLEKTQGDAGRIAVLFTDLDNFKHVNDSLGHATGDKLLLEVGQKLCRYWGHETLVAREGGDEFIVVVQDYGDPGSLAESMQGALAIFRDPILVDGHYIYVSMSMGAALYPGDGEGIDKLLMNADTALYHAKAEGKSRFAFYEPSMNAVALRRLELQNALRKSIERGQLEFYFQPLINCHSRSIGFEALLRWNHPEKGLVYPTEFIQIAEQTGFILEINKWMFDAIFEQIQQWLNAPEFRFDKVAINVSPLQLQSPEFVDVLMRARERWGIPASMVELEITENVFLENLEQAEEVMKMLSAMGFALALDDFGTGYSSLSYLQRLPFDRLKIDKSFVCGIPEGNSVPPLIEGIVDMADSLGLEVTAEGVEKAYQFEMLRRLKCQVFQGYHFSRPLKHEQCVQWAADYSSRHFDLPTPVSQA